ncbi:MAG: hypothetical protein U0904_08835 [Candidatus Nanopelagicales bacterium]|nr:hypothetical protein [Candidatus Nanopelagicales bacterium]
MKSQLLFSPRVAAALAGMCVGASVLSGPAAAATPASSSPSEVRRMLAEIEAALQAGDAISRDGLTARASMFGSAGRRSIPEAELDVAFADGMFAVTSDSGSTWSRFHMVGSKTRRFDTSASQLAINVGFNRGPRRSGEIVAAATWKTTRAQNRHLVMGVPIPKRERSTIDLDALESETIGALLDISSGIAHPKRVSRMSKRTNGASSLYSYRIGAPKRSVLSRAHQALRMKVKVVSGLVSWASATLRQGSSSLTQRVEMTARGSVVSPDTVAAPSGLKQVTWSSLAERGENLARAERRARNVSARKIRKLGRVASVLDRRVGYILREDVRRIGKYLGLRVRDMRRSGRSVSFSASLRDPIHVAGETNWRVQVHRTATIGDRTRSRERVRILLLPRHRKLNITPWFPPEPIRSQPEPSSVSGFRLSGWASDGPL